MFDKSPTKPYSGLTIVLASPSRFDKTELLSGWAGGLFRDYLDPLSLSECDLRLPSNKAFLPGTKVVLLLGQQSIRTYLPSLTHTLGEMRGCPYEKDGIIYIASYMPQDAADMKASYEKDFNTHVQEQEDEVEDKETNEKSSHGKTARSNFGFWLEADVAKAKRLLKEPYRNLMIEQQNYARIEIYPPLEEAIAVLNNAHEYLYLDIETDACLNLTCIGFATTESLPSIYVIPIKRYNDCLAYDNLPRFFKALSVAALKCCTVGHNLNFDLLVLACGFGVPFGRRQYDTMLACHRLNVDAEKSLGHAVSYYTYMPYHKSEGVFDPKNEFAEKSLWLYNGKDVAVLPLIMEAQEDLAKLRRAESSIAQVQDSRYAYLMITLTGIRLDHKRMREMIQRNDRWMNQTLRIIRCLVGHDVLPTSSQQCVNYFHKELALPVVSRNKLSHAPSLDEKAMWKLALSQKNHPLIPLFLFYRQLKRETGTLLSTPWSMSDTPGVYPGWKDYYHKVVNDKTFNWIDELETIL